MQEDTKILAGKRILVIDDEPDVVTYFTTLLEDHDMTTLSAANGQQGLVVAREQHPDLITLDVAMPERTGVKALKQLQEDPELSDIPVVMITGVSQELETFLKKTRQVQPPTAFLCKPIDEEEFLQLLVGIFSGRISAAG